MANKTVILLALLTVTSFAAAAQDAPKPKADDRTPSVTPLRVQVVFSEFDGEKKVSNLPYSFTVNADERRARPGSQIRNGARFPVATGKDQITYIDIGTNVDCSATQQEDGRFKLQMTQRPEPTRPRCVNFAPKSIRFLRTVRLPKSSFPPIRSAAMPITSASPSTSSNKAACSSGRQIQ
jgi:hypothetical protein